MIVGSEKFEKFKNLLKNDIFRLDFTDLDFGIYRILNYRKKEIEDFIDNKLKTEIENILSINISSEKQKLEDKKKELIEKIKSNLTEGAIDEFGSLKEEYKSTNLGREYENVLKELKDMEESESVMLDIYNDLYTFFSRYYENGDFVPQRRYRFGGENNVYVIPYNGEEVKLYWATAGQYYIKTGTLFRDYTFTITTNENKEYRIVFRVVSATDELNSNKEQRSKTRFFLPSNPLLEKERDMLVVNFEYRELSENEKNKFSKSRDRNENEEEESEKGNGMKLQMQINKITYAEILKELDKLVNEENLESLKDKIKNEVEVMKKHLNRFTAKNKMDFFIHKNLKEFLSKQLDYFIKSEILDIHILTSSGNLNKHILRAKAVKEIGERIIDFISQIENFQKMLWEKKKFVIKTEYVITTDRVPEEFYEEIWNNEKQKNEWEELGLDIPSSIEKLKNSKLPVDTKNFSEDFKEKLLEKLTEERDLDNLLDGVLIKSENWQALNLLMEKYKGKVQTIYIDPPFNKENDADYLYLVKYKDATWITMLENRLRLAREFLKDSGSIFVRCDYNGNMYVRLLMNEIFGKENFRNEIVVNRSFRPTEEINRFHTAHDSIYFFSKTENYTFLGASKERSKPKWRPMHLPGIRWSPIEPEFVELFSKENLKEKKGKIVTRARIILGRELLPPEGRHWALSQKAIFELEKQGRIKLSEKGEPLALEPENKKVTDNWTDIVGFSKGWSFPTENSEILLKRVIESTSNEGDLIMDFFLGSGTTCAVAHKLKRKWIGIEMGEHFYSVVLPRMKKVLAYDKSGISEEKDVKEKYNPKNAGGFFKYHEIEQYEDTLDNIQIQAEENSYLKEQYKDDYLIKYFLKYETKGSLSIPSVFKLLNPFKYKLKVNILGIGKPEEVFVDIPETFNYLLGIKVKKIKTRKNNGRKYLFILGEKDGKSVCIVWRDMGEVKEESDFDFIDEQIRDWNPSIVYVSGDTVVYKDRLESLRYNLRAIEPEFIDLMGAALWE